VELWSEVNGTGFEAGEMTDVEDGDADKLFEQ
jgi:hypothetical protein